MKFNQLTPDSLALHVHAWRIALLCAIGALLIAVLAIRQWNDGIEEIIGPIIGSAMMLLGAWLSYYEARCVLDARIEKLHWKIRRFGSTKTGSVFFRDITGIYVDTRICIGSGDESDTYQLMLDTTSGKIPLTLPMSGTQEELKLAADRLCHFIGLPATNTYPLLLKKTLAEGRTIEAAKLIRRHEDISLTAAMQKIKRMERHEMHPNT